MKILIAVHHYPPNHMGGAELRAHRTALEMQARGHQVKVICVEKIDQPVSGVLEWIDELYEGVEVRRLFYNLAAAKDPFRLSYDNTWIGDHLETLLKEGRPDIVHLFSGYIMSGSVIRAARRQAVPVVVSLTEFWFLCPRLSFLCSNNELSTLPLDPVRCARCLGEASRRWRYLHRFFPLVSEFIWRMRCKSAQKIRDRSRFLLETLNQANIIISPSNFLRDMHIQAGVDPEKIIFSRQGRYPVNGKVEVDPPVKENRSLQIGCISQIAHHKGIHVLIEAVRMLPDAKINVCIYGDYLIFDRYMAKLEQMVAGDPRIAFCGVFPRDQLGKIMSGLDVVVVPSIWYENSPNVILEAFAYKTPVIATNLGGMAELVQHNRNGLLFNRGDARGLRDQIQRLLDEPDLLHHLRAGIQPVRSIADEMDELQLIYANVLAVNS